MFALVHFSPLVLQGFHLIFGSFILSLLYGFSFFRVLHLCLFAFPARFIQSEKTSLRSFIQARTL